MQTRFLLAFLVMTFSLPVLASRYPGKVSLRLVDEKGQGLDGVFAQLVNKKDSSLVKTALSEPGGSLEFINLPVGDYLVVVSQVGYEKYFSGPVSITEASPELALPDITLKKSVVELKAVEIKEKTPFIERQADRLVVNVENSIVSTGNSALDVLQRSPGVIVDQNDNISLKGKPNVIVMIDGKPSPLSGTDLGNLLRGMSSSSIEKIELISNPSARYDAAGNAGIINIKLKKDKRFGTNGNLSASYGQGIYPKTSESIGLNHRTAKYNVFGNYNYSYRKAFNHLTLYRKFYDGEKFTGAYDQDNYLVFPFVTHSARTGADFFLSKKTTIGVVANGLSNSFDPGGQNISYVLDNSEQRRSYFTTTNNSHDRWYNYALNANLKHTIDSTGKELTCDLDHAHYWNQTYQNFTTLYYDMNGNKLKNTDSLYGDLSGSLYIYAFKADYTQPFKNGAKLETGVKSSLVKADNDLIFSNVISQVAVYDSTKSNHFLYSENINAAYLNMNKEFEKFSLQGGLRAEQTIAKGIQLVNGRNFSRDYVQLFPSFAGNYKLSKNHELGISVSRRIDRPTYSQLNPFRFYLDPSTYKEGNPYLRSQDTYAYELSHVFKQEIVTSLSYSRTHNIITNVLIPSETEKQVTIQIDKNLDRYEYYGFNITIPKQVTDWWNTNNNFIVYYSHYHGNLSNTALNKGQATWFLSSHNTFQLPSDFSLELNGWYNSTGIDGYIIAQPMWDISFGAQKKILKRKGNLKLSVTDMMWANNPRGATALTGYKETFVVKRETRVATLSFSYSFGKSTVGQSRRKAGGAEDEKKRAGTGM